MQTENPTDIATDAAASVGGLADGSGMGSFADQAVQSAGFENLAPPLQIALFLGAMVLLSGALVTITAFTRIVIVLSFVRRALSTQEIPPTQVIIGLSLFMTLFVMAEPFNNITQKAVNPYFEQQVTIAEAFELAKDEMLGFMFQQLDNESGHESIDMFMEISNTTQASNFNEVPPHVIVPAFIIHELRLAFIMGFCIYIPFLLIDLVVSTVLMSLGMMMMPPVIISTPCKLMLFVLVDGWGLVVGTLAMSFEV